ncbi:MAG: hypothetical protein ACKVVT_06810 [Dehalococcoidia bacterium]
MDPIDVLLALISLALIGVGAGQMLWPERFRHLHERPQSRSPLARRRVDVTTIRGAGFAAIGVGALGLVALFAPSGLLSG